MIETYTATTAERPVDQLDVGARAQFITRTYTHLFGALAAFVGIEVLLFSTGVAWDIASAMLSTSWLLVLGGFMLASTLASHLAMRARSYAAQYAALIGFVLVEALIFVPLLAIAFTQFPGAIGNAAVVTLGSFAGLTAIVFLTRKNFSFLRPFVMFGGITAGIAILCGLLFGFSLGIWFDAAMVLFAGGIILYQTSNVLHVFPEDRYVAAALQLFSAIALFFWYVLRIFMSRD